MRYRLIFIPICFISLLSIGQKLSFNIKYSEQLAVFVFLQNLSENSPDNAYKTEFKKSVYNNDKYLKLISAFDKLSIDYSYPFTEFPYGSKLPGMTEALLEKNLISTTTLTDFKLRSIGIVTNKSLNELTELIAEFTPVYNELIYNPAKEKFEKQVREITAYANSHGIEDYFQTGLLFYNSSWDNTIPFEIAFYPLLNSKGFTAHAFYNDFVSAIETNLTDYTILFSVMMHEIYHILYDEQSLEVKTEIEEDFRENKSGCSTYAYLLLNEVLATALGNGYVYEKLNGTPDKSDWYNRKYINLMARQIYPLVKEYISQKKPIDKPFIDAYVKAYDQNFSGWLNELDNVMAYRYVLSEDSRDFEIIDQLFPYRSCSNYEDEISGESIQKLQQTPITKVIIVSRNNGEQLKLVKKGFPELHDWKYKNGKEFTYRRLLADKTFLYIINKKGSSTELLFEKLLKEDK
jgi:hypothetical protein